MPTSQTIYKNRKLAANALLVALGLAVHTAESYIPVLAPGVKFGFANVFTLVAYSKFGIYDAAAVTALRIFLGGLFAGFGLSFACSAAGGAAALLVLYVCKFKKLRNLSTAQAIAFNAAQLCVVWYMVGDLRAAAYYGPVLLISALITGQAIGAIADKIIKILGALPQTPARG